MTDRYTADTINDDALDQLYDRLSAEEADNEKLRRWLLRCSHREAIERVENLRDKWLAWPVGDMHYAAGLMLARYLEPVPAPAAAEATGPHVYLSTGCYHGDHAYCQNTTGLNGAKRPAECKKCGAPCICACHTTTKTPPAPCPACRRADQAGLAASELHTTCADKEQHMPTCTATIEGPHVLGGGPVQCTREAGHPENHVGPKRGSAGRTLWTDHNAGATPHGVAREEEPGA